MNRFTQPYQRDERSSRSWNIPGTPDLMHQIGGLEKQGAQGVISYDADNHACMVALRAKKINGIAQEYPPLVVEGDPLAQLLLVGWGSTYGSLKSAAAECESQGVSVALLHLRHLHPLPEDLGMHLSSFKQVAVVELNSGHLCEVLRAKYLLDLKSIQQCNGQQFSSRELVNTITDMTKEIHHETVLA